MWYASLTGPLLGLYYPIEADSKDQARVMINTSKLKGLWCSIYRDDELDEQLAQFGGIKLPMGFTRKLDYDSYAVDQYVKESHHAQDR